LTTRCPLRCRMCIRDSAEAWTAADMPIENFRRLAPYFRNVENVVLEGWGEPLLYKDLTEAVKIVKRAGSHPGFITSGWGLNRSHASDLITNGLDFIGFSLAGATSKTHASIRVNSDLSGIIEAIQDFNEIKIDYKLTRPHMHIVFLVLKDNLAEIPLLLDLAKRIGIESVVLINLVHVANEWQNRQRIFACDDGDSRSIFAEARAKANELNIALKECRTSPQTLAVCEEDPLRNIFISVEGEVAPCVYLYPPIASGIKKIYCNRGLSAERRSFGNIFTEPLERIWNGRDYVAFRKSLTLRKRRFEELYSLSSSIAPAMKYPGSSHDEISAAPPVSCRTCHRMLGL
jgi:MoaA/NifB/PqqE/SkfB family radical SAM enzyme